MPIIYFETRIGDLMRILCPRMVRIRIVKSIVLYTNTRTATLKRVSSRCRRTE